MPRSSDTATLPSDVDLHARPASDFVRAAMGYGSTVSVSIFGGDGVDAKSLLSVLALGAKGGTELTITAEGDDADDAVAELTALVSSLTE